jgi:hypothetical protein
MKWMQGYAAYLAQSGLMRLLMAALMVPLVFAGCASQGVKGAYLDAAEVGSTFPTTVSAVTSANLPIYTKVAGVPFNLDVLGGFYKTDNTSVVTNISGNYATGDSNIDLVDLSDAGCSSACSGSVGDSCQVSGVTIGSPTTHAYGGGVGSNGSSYYNWTGAEKGRKTYLSFTVPKALAKARVRIYGKACNGGSCITATMCSTDAFTVRPASFSVTSTPSSGNAVAAGNTYTMTATAVNNAGTTTTDYNGTPSLTTTSMTDWRSVAIATGAFSGSFGAASSGVASGSFSYSDFGPLTIPAGAINDNTFVSSSGSGDVAGGDCVVGSNSNTLTGGLYGCNIGNQASVTTPKFIAHHYRVTSSITPACGSFSYLGQPVSVQLTVDALNLAGNKLTRLTAGAPNKPTFDVQQLNGGSPMATEVIPLSANLMWSPDTTFGTTGGQYFTSSTVVPSAVTATSKRPDGLSASSAAPPDYESFTLTTVASDALITSCNGASVSTSACPSTATKLRYGVLKLTDGQGTAISPASVQVTAQYWNGSSFVTNTADSCTTINLNAGTIAATTTPRPVARSTSITLVNGVGSFMLNATQASNWLIQLGSSPRNCLGSGGGSIPAGVGSPLNALSYLGSRSCLNGYDQDPSAQMSFGTLRSTYIYRSEKF